MFSEYRVSSSYTFSIFIFPFSHFYSFLILMSYFTSTRIMHSILTPYIPISTYFLITITNGNKVK